MLRQRAAHRLKSGRLTQAQRRQPLAQRRDLDQPRLDRDLGHARSKTTLRAFEARLPRDSYQISAGISHYIIGLCAEAPA
jgi:hypothetical protein